MQQYGCFSTQTPASGDEAKWTFEYTGTGNDYYIKSSDGKYININSGNNTGDVSLVNGNSAATRFYIETEDGKYRMAIRSADGYGGYYTSEWYLDYEPNYFKGAWNNYANNTWLTLTDYVEPTVYDKVGDWLLYFDDDFSGKEINIHVGETITLRPYKKWEWKENDQDVQTAHWNVGTWSDWSITSSDQNGDKYDVTSSGPFEFTRYVKYDDQLETHYWSVQGRATQTGTYTLTNTKETDKTINVRVVADEPDNKPYKPDTIKKIANIKVNLFDYDYGGALDEGLVNGETNKNLANNENFKNESVNQMGGSSQFYFLSSGGGNKNGKYGHDYGIDEFGLNDYTQDRAHTGLVQNTLNPNGYPYLANYYDTNQSSLQYLFDTSTASQTWHGGSDGNGMIAYPDVVGMFQKDSDGYYYFNSNTNYFYYNTDTKTANLYEHTYTQTSSADKGSLVNDKPIGFFPFHDYDATDNLYVNQNKNLNHHLGMSMDVEFILPEGKKDDNNENIIFDFSGDDDMWVFVEWKDRDGTKHNQLLLDLGGIHQPIHGQINFTDGISTSGQTFNLETNRPYTLKVFYLERGGCDSNCSIRFNLPVVQDLTVAKKLTGLTEAEKKKYKDEVFTYVVAIDGVPYTGPREGTWEKIIRKKADGTTEEIPSITNGIIQIKDGESVSISYLRRKEKFTVAELNTSNMKNFEVPNAERYYHLSHDASLYEEEIDLIEKKTEDDPPVVTSWITPQYELEDTEKVTFTNTLQEKNLEVEKKWKGGKAHPDNIKFKVSATVDDGSGGRTSYTVKELKKDDGTTDREFTLNDDNDWRTIIEHLPVYTPAPDNKFIFYDIQETQVEGYVLTGSVDITADQYFYCNVDVVKLWPDSNGDHTEVLQVVLKNSEGKYYAGVDEDDEAIFVDNINSAEVRDLNLGNNYTQRYSRLPFGDYTAVQLHEDEYNKGLSTYRRAIIQYELENTPLEKPVNPTEEPDTPVIHKRIDALRDGVPNPDYLDSDHADEDLTDLYRLYLDYKVNSLQDPKGVDLLFVIDHSGSMNDSHWPGNVNRARAVEAALNGDDGVISRFLAANEKNQWAAVGFKGPDGFRDYEFSLTNPWEPKVDHDVSNYNAGLNGSEVLSPSEDSYEFTNLPGSISLSDEGPLMQSNYTAGFWRAEQFLLNEDVKKDNRKKVVVFITDGVPTLHIDNLNGSLQNAGTAAGGPYYREEYGGCPDKALTEFGYFVTDMTNNGYLFGGDNGNIEFYTIGLGASMQTAGGAELLNGMLSAAYGQNVPANHYMTITDPGSSDYSAAAATLNKDLRIILGLNHTFSNLVIQDNLSKYVDLYGLADAGSSASAIMTAAKAKVTMAVPDPDHPENSPQVITLYENGAPVDSDDAKFTKSDGQTQTKATIIKELQYDAVTKTVKAVFDPEYQPARDVTYILSFDVKATEEAYTTYANNGYDKYLSGDNQGQIITGDPDTDFLGTTPANATSVGKEGFRSNDEAKATYKHNTKNEEMIYPHPVIQVALIVDIVKIDQEGAALEGAIFNLYSDQYDAGKTIEENVECLIEANLQSKKPTDPAGQDAVIRSGKLSAGTYYLVETEAPDGYYSLPGPVEIIITEVSGNLRMTAKIAGENVGGDKLEEVKKGLWKLRVQNSAGYELPSTGGPGTHLFTILGSILIFGAGVLLWRRRSSRA